MQTAIDERDGGVDNVTDDMDDLLFRRDALDVVASADWITSVLCGGRIAAWLQARAALVPDRIAMVTARQQALAPAVDALTAGQRAEVWAVVAARIQVPERQQGDGCEYLAHAVCEVVQAEFPDFARRRLGKLWLIANSNRLHPPDNWRHHVAPLLDCQDGWYVLDPFLSADEPLTRAAWLVAARGGTAEAGLTQREQPWELLGCPTANVADFEKDTRIPSEDGSDARIAINQCKTAAA